VAIPTLFYWASMQPDPWSFKDRALRNALSTICRTVYGSDLDFGLDDNDDDEDDNKARIDQPAFLKAPAFSLVRIYQLYLPLF
jgi:hypothetical protein